MNKQNQTKLNELFLINFVKLINGNLKSVYKTKKNSVANIFSLLRDKYFYDIA